MTPHFYDPFQSGAISFVELNKRRRSTNSKMEDGAGESAISGGQGPNGRALSRSRKHGGSEPLPIYERRDQTVPQAFVIYVFLNGDGLRCRHVTFTRVQLELGGMECVLELVARAFCVRSQRLVRMDGTPVRETHELMTRGAYVLIARGERFRSDCWYFLPDCTADTSVSRALLECQQNRCANTGSRRTRCSPLADGRG